MQRAEIRGGAPRPMEKLIPRKLMGAAPGLGAGHAACSGCPAPSIVQATVHAARVGLHCEPIVTFATGCLEVVTSLYPRNAWRIPYMHSGLVNSAAVAAGIETALRARRQRGEIPEERDIKVIAFGGDGATYDIGLQALSGAMERGHDLTYVCYNNEACMNTGVQRSSATPYLAFTYTAPTGTEQKGKEEFTKDLTRIMIAHELPYVAQASVHRYQDMLNKLEKAIAVRGPSFVNVLSACPVGWGTNTSDALRAAELAVESCMWPLYEYANGRYRITYKPTQRLPLIECLKAQRRFAHLTLPEAAPLVARLQEYVDLRWAELLELEASTARTG